MATAFTLFPRLPPELRSMIWKSCIPSRVVELHTASTDFNINTNCELDWTSRQIALPPVVTRVFRESRYVALLTGANRVTPIPAGSDGLECRDCPVPPWIESLWFDCKADSVAVYWDLGHEDFGTRGHKLEQARTPLILADQIYCIRSSPSERGHCLRLEQQLSLAGNKDNITQIKKFNQAIPEEDEWAHSFLQQVLDEEAFEATLNQWRDEFQTHWVWKLWEGYSLQPNFTQMIESPQEVWLGPEVDENGEPLDLLDRRTYMG
ncbi:hypothetical protein N7540_007875 [Penicillium herquei]|nr:hypothetical protein N7540_007875 [Penicillium herquei]